MLLQAPLPTLDQAATESNRAEPVRMRFRASKPAPEPPPPPKPSPKASTPPRAAPAKRPPRRRPRPPRRARPRLNQPPADPAPTAPARAPPQPSGAALAPLPKVRQLPSNATPARPPPAERLPEGLVRKPDGTYIYDAGPFSAHINEDGSFYFKDYNIRQELLPGDVMGDDDGQVGGQKLSFSIVVYRATFDITDTLMRAVGEDPYTARKLDFVRETRALRMQLYRETLRKNLDNALFDLKPRLVSLWTDAEMDAAERRKLLFEIWDGALFEGKSERAITGRAVRAVVIAFIREHLPRGSKQAYSAAELLRLGRIRTSSVPFAPYRAL